MKNIYFPLLIVLFSSCLCFSQIGGYSLYFDGVNDYVSVPHSSNLNFTAFTAEAWVCCVGTSNGKILGKCASGSAAPGFNIGINDNKTYCFEVFGNTGSYVQKNTSITNASGIWTHVAMSWSTGGYMRCYVNGVEVASVASPSLTITTSNNFIIGMAPWGLNQNYFKGKIDEVRLWSVVRTESEIKANMYKELAGNETGLKAYYKMSNGSGTSLTDNQSNVTENTGTINNGATWEASGCFAGPKNCLDFDGTDDYVSLPLGLSTASNGLSQFTVSTWIYPASIKDWSAVFSKKYGSGFNDRFYLQFYNSSSYGSNGLIASVSNGSSAFGYTSSGTPVTTNTYIEVNKWYYVTVVFDGTQSTNSDRLKIYVNGKLQVLIFEGTIPATTFSSGGTFNLGKEEGCSETCLQGRIDEYRFWNTVRTSAQILEDMTKSSIGSETGLLSYYNFDYKDGTVLYDLTSNAYNGTLTNMDPSTDWVSSSAFNTWIGCESNEWSTATNWSKGSVPVSTDNTGIYEWALGNELSLSGVPTTNHMFFSSTSSPTLNSNFTTNGELLLNKDINLNGYTITLGSNGYLNEGDYRLYGTSGTITTTRTLSNISAQNVGGLGAIITTSANMGSTTITRGHTTQGNNCSISRYYDITPTTNTGLNATLVFNYYDNELNGNTETDLKLFKSTNSGTNWTLQNSSTVNTTNNTITLTGMDGFSRWTAANSYSPMPVELISFTSNVTDRNVTLNWKTGKEINNKGFEIERKITNGDWIKVGYKEGKGTTNEATTYSFNDTKLNSGKYNYRLKQIDFNGNFTYHNLNGTVEIGIPKKYNLNQNYPNPFNPTTKIEFEIPNISNVTLKVYDITGKEIATLVNEKLQAGVYEIPFSINQLSSNQISSGVYFYKLTSDNFSATKKMIVLK